METFINNIIRIRKKYGLSKKEMAKIMHIGVGSLSMLEKGEMPKRMSVDAVFYLSAYFGIRCSDWFAAPFDDKKELP